MSNVYKMKRVANFVKPLSIRLVRKGCANRPFYHIVVVNTDDRCVSEGIEQLGVFDPMPNERGERLLSMNLERFKYYVAEGAWIRSSIGRLLGTAGVLPIHPHAVSLGWRNRRVALGEDKKNAATDA